MTQFPEESEDIWTDLPATSPVNFTTASVCVPAGEMCVTSATIGSHLRD